MKDRYNISQIVGANVRSLRKQNNLSQLELAEKADLSLTFINNIENGKKWVSPETLSILCAVLNAYPFEFFVTSDVPDDETRGRARKANEDLLHELSDMVTRYRQRVDPEA